MSPITSPATRLTFRHALDEVKHHPGGCSIRRAACRWPATTLFFLRVSNYRNGGALWVLQHGESPHLGDILGSDHNFSAELFRQLGRGIDIVYRHIAYPIRRHSLGMGWYRHDTALPHFRAADFYNRVGEVRRRPILSSPSKQLRIKLRRCRRIGSH